MEARIKSLLFDTPLCKVNRLDYVHDPIDRTNVPGLDQ